MDMGGERPLPFWHSGQVQGESVLFMEQADGSYEGRLMRVPQEQRVELYDLYGAIYEEGVDYCVKGNRLLRLSDARIPGLSREAYMPSGDPADAARYAPFRKGGGLLLYMEDRFLVDRQVYATYRIAEGQQGFCDLGHRPNRLMKTQARLQARQHVEIVLIGDSLGEGCNCSAMLGIYPFAQAWYTQFAVALTQRYRTRVEIPPGWNLSKGGELSAYGVGQAVRAAAWRPDLAILEFGGNDGTFHVTPEQFSANVEQMMGAILAGNPECEFILCASLLANPYSIQCGNQADYLAPLLALEARYPCAAVADFTTLHAAMMSQGKPFGGLAANNINHPNDFVIHAMADCMLELLSHGP